MKTESEVKDMLALACEEKKWWFDYYKSKKMSTKQNAEALRNYTALRGVEKTLRWVLEQIKEEPIK
tara:strand:+ start:4451 stop:4648 length:198 start_codon:yes stop_codon:yes gene_type:complete